MAASSGININELPESGASYGKPDELSREKGRAKFQSGNPE
jgi:hypothetical protein